MQRYIKLLRPHQWLKNLFIFLPIFFDKHLFDLRTDFLLLIVFLSFSLAASAIYCVNDIVDVEADRRHFKKKLRPIASGQISERSAWFLVIILLSLSLLTLWIPIWGGVIRLTEFSNVLFAQASILSVYVVLNFLYSFCLKRIAIIDVFIIAIGFLLRVWIGAITSQTFLSQWIILLTFLLALFLAFAKRRDDVIQYEKTGLVLRRNIVVYNLQFMNQILTILASVIIVSYIMYCTSPEVEARLGTDKLYVTTIFVLLGVIRYLQITTVKEESGSPTKVLLKDRCIQGTLILWILSFLIILYA